MEENKYAQGTAEKPTYEQLEQAVSYYQQRAYMAEQRFNMMDIVETKLNFMFKVIELKDNFDPEFVSKCSHIIEEAFTEKTPEEENKKENKEEK